MDTVKINEIKVNKDILFYQKGRIDPDLQTIYVDVDDVVLNTSEAVIIVLKEIFKEDLGIKNFSLKDVLYWDYSNFIKGRLTKEQFLKIFESDLFWRVVETNKEMVKLLEEWIGCYNIVLVTKGTELNLERKLKWKNMLSERDWVNKAIGFVGIKNGASKGLVDMSGGILIDDNCENFIDTKAETNILYRLPETNGNSDYNGDRVVAEVGLSNLYITEYVDQIDDILNFNYHVNRLGEL